MDGVRADQTAAVRRSIAVALRAGRAQLSLSQRELAERARLSQSIVARLETERSDPRLSNLVAALDAIGARLVIPGVTQPTRMAGAYARDAAGRRLPAHLEPYRLERPHDWWPGTTNILMWRHEPKWSYRRRWPES